jgi:UDP-N-acetylenolpyruvoylglucosamine reductase
MAKDLKSAVIRSISDIQKTISQKSSEVEQLQKQLQNYKSVLSLLGQTSHLTVNGGKSPRTDLRTVLDELPESFSSADFVKAAAGKKKDPAYLRQTLVRWAAQGRLKRMERGKYHKTKKA